MKDSRRNRANAAAQAAKRATYGQTKPPENKLLPEDYKARLADHFKGDA